jgi:hypothetical protein
MMETNDPVSTKFINTKKHNGGSKRGLYGYSFIVRKFQRGLSSMETWCERWSIKINEDKIQGI